MEMAKGSNKRGAQGQSLYLSPVATSEGPLSSVSAIFDGLGDC